MKVPDVEVVLDKPRDDGEKKTKIHAKLVFSFEEIYVQQYILNMPFINGREFDYRLLSECGDEGIELQFSLTYDVKRGVLSYQETNGSSMSCQLGSKGYAYIGKYSAGDWFQKKRTES